MVLVFCLTGAAGACGFSSGLPDGAGGCVSLPVCPVRLGALGDYEGFALQESEERAKLCYPPHGRVMRVLIEDKDEKRVGDTAARIAFELRKTIGTSGAEIAGPSACPHALVRGKHRHHMLLRAPCGEPVFERGVRRAIELAAGFTRPAVKLDVDPMSVL